ncbi:MAG: peptidoglycan-binding protein [Actinomycetota bacterium]|nr:MAG: peptidoglycan-binding protein [Actinomycetota bacterium]
MQKRWGGTVLGGYFVRPVRGGTRWSAHAFGAAIDHGLATRHGGPGINTVEKIILPWLVDSSAELGIQVVHHYAKWSQGPHQGANRWKAGKGWYVSSIGSGDWLHIETHPDRWADATPVDQRLAAPALDLPEFAPDRGLWSLWPFWQGKPTVRLGTTGDAVRYLQGVLKHKAGQTQLGPVDGVLGNQTLSAVLNVQRFFTPQAVDGVVGPKTWTAVDYLAGLR